VAAALRGVGIWCNGEQPKFKFEQHEWCQAKGTQQFRAPTKLTASEAESSQEGGPSRWHDDHGAPTRRGGPAQRDAGSRCPQEARGQEATGEGGNAQWFQLSRDEEDEEPEPAEADPPLVARCFCARAGDAPSDATTSRNSILRSCPAACGAPPPKSNRQLKRERRRLESTAKAFGVVSATQCLVCAETGHKKGNCKYKDSICGLCSRKGHLAAACWRDQSEMGTTTAPKASTRVQQASSSIMMNMEVKQEPTPEVLPPCHSQGFRQQVAQRTAEIVAAQILRDMQE